MNDHEVDQVGAYVLDALDPEERAAFENHLRGCSMCQAEVAELRQVVDVLPLAADVAEPPSALRGRIMDAVRDDIGDRPDLVPLQPRPEAPAPVSLAAHRTRRGFGMGLLAVAAAIIVAALGVWNIQLQQSVNDKQKTVAIANDVLQAELDHPVVAVMPGRGAARGASAKVIEPRHGSSVYMVVNGLPTSPANRVYQLWVMNGGSHPIPVSAGVFTSSGRGVQYLKMPRPREGYRVTALTVEPGPSGSKSPTTQPIMIGKFGA